MGSPHKDKVFLRGVAAQAGANCPRLFLKKLAYMAKSDKIPCYNYIDNSKGGFHEQIYITRE